MLKSQWFQGGLIQLNFIIIFDENIIKDGSWEYFYSDRFYNLNSWLSQLNPLSFDPCCNERNLINSTIIDYLKDETA